MSLAEKLAATREASAKRLPPESRAVMHSATERLRACGIMDRVIKPGVVAPDFALPDQKGQMVALSALLTAGAVVVSVFRGFW